MPIPNVKPQEKQQDYILRFMSDPKMQEEYPDEKQRLAIANTTWEKSKKDSLEKVTRMDAFRLDIKRTDKFEITSQGFLKCDAWLTRTGIFIYRDSKGNITKELRTPEEVFNTDSLASLKLIPVTYNHPDEMITVDNVKKYQVGTTGENVTQDGDYVACTVLITDKDTINEIQRKHSDFKNIELSCGYDCQLEYIGGDYKGEKYDAVQKNIKYNHLSIVDRGRAGRNVKLKLDKGGKSMGLIKFVKKTLKLDSFSMDSINLEYPEEAKSVVDCLNNKLDEAIEVIKKQDEDINESVKKINGFQKKLDEANEENKKLKTDNEELKNPNSQRIKDMIQRKADIESLADKLKVEKKDKDQKTLMIDIIKATSSNFDAEGKSDEYIKARYDSIIELAKEVEKKDNDNILGAFIKNAHDDNNKPTDPRGELLKKCDEEFNKTE